MFRSYTPVAEIFSTNMIDKSVTVCGWIRSVRHAGGGTILFIDLTDGSCSDVLKIIFDNTQDIPKLSTGTSVRITGTIVKSPERCEQDFELRGETIHVYGEIEDPEKYPVPKKRLELSYLRSVPTLRGRSAVCAGIFRIRDTLQKSMEEFMRQHYLIRTDPNVITASDCEGAGELFCLSGSEEFFGKKAFLTVSSQLHLEAMALCLGNVYTMNKSFRAERSLTNKHVAEFTHVEAELSFINMQELLDFTEQFVKHCIRTVTDECEGDLKVLEQFHQKPIRSKLRGYLDSPFVRVTHREAVDLLNNLLQQHKIRLPAGLKPKKLETLRREGLVVDTAPSHELDLDASHERAITMHYGKPVFITHWPHKIKSFYMRGCEDGTCESFDLLTCEVGELFGGSMREDDYDKLLAEMEKRKMGMESLRWYLNLRKNGSVPHGGWGCGFDRFVVMLTGADSIKDTIPFPVYCGSVDY